MPSQGVLGEPISLGTAQVMPQQEFIVLNLPKNPMGFDLAYRLYVLPNWPVESLPYHASMGVVMAEL